MTKRKSDSGLNSWVKFSGIAFEMIAIIGLGSFLGHKLDGRFLHKTPVFTIVFSLLAIGVSMYTVIRRVKQMNKNE